MIGWSEIIQNVIYFISLYYVVFWMLVLLDSEPTKKKRISEYPEISIVVPAYNEQNNIVKTLESVETLDYPKEKISIIVVDDGSKDATYKNAQRFLNHLKFTYSYKSLTLLKQKNKGKYAAMNLAIKHVYTALFASLDADSYPEKDALKKIVACFEDKEITAASSIVKVAKPENYIQTIQWIEYLVNHYYKSLITRINAVHVLPGPLSVYRTDAIKKIGCFKEAHKTEDMEIALRLHLNGYKIVQCNQAFVHTNAPYSIKSLFQQRHRWNYGTFKNLIEYRKMMFNRKYGDFGMFQLPIIMISGFLGVTIIGLILYDSIKSAKPTFLMLQQYKFNLIEYFVHTHLNIIWLDLDLKSMVTFAGFFAISLLIIWLSFKLYKEKIPLRYPFSFIAYLFFYYLFLAVVWIVVLKDVVLNKGTEWKGVRGR
jgi:poly-beta-1,6-N-acetyl-D-glucosamine synthase